jgi:hypothetical protein
MLPAVLLGTHGKQIYAVEARPVESPRYLNLHQLAVATDGVFFPTEAIVEHLAHDNYRIVVRGDSLLPADAIIRTHLEYGDKTVGADTRAWQPKTATLGEMRIHDSPLHSGRYSVVLAWKASSATPEERVEVGRLVPGPLPPEMQLRRPIYLGRASDEESEQQRIVQYVRAVLAEAQAGRDLLLLLTWELRDKASEPKGSPAPIGPDRPEHAARWKLLTQYPPFEVAASILRAADHQRFDVEKWRKLIDETLPARWRRFRDDPELPFPDKYPLLGSNVPILFNQLLRLARLESQLLYQHFGQKLHPNDFVDSDFGIEAERTQTARRVEQLFRTLREAMGIEPSRPVRSP